MLIDLQFHSTYSDGYLTPAEVVEFIAGQGVKVAALTDHNTVGGLDEFRKACQKYRVKSVTGLELYVKLGERRLNFLWFNFNETDSELHGILRKSQLRKRQRVRLILEKLTKRGFKLDTEKILDKYSHYIPMNRIVDEVVAVKSNLIKIKRELNLKNPREADIVHKYFRDKEIGILRESYIGLEKILKLREKIGGQLILNHPGKHNRLQRNLLEKLKKQGVDGLEVLSPHHSIGAVMYAQYIARELNFITTGGSDFHRHEGNNFPVQNSWQYFKIDTKYLRGVKKIIG